MKKIILLLISIFIIFYLIISFDKSEIYFDTSSLGGCDISIYKDTINIQDSRLNYSFIKTEKDINDFLEDEELVNKHGLSEVVSVRKEVKKGFSDAMYVNYLSSSNFTGSFSSLEGEMLLLKKRNNMYIFSYVDGIDACDSKAAFYRIFNTIELK